MCSTSAKAALLSLPLFAQAFLFCIFVKETNNNYMSGSSQRDALQRQIWKIANDVRGAEIKKIIAELEEDE